MDVSIIIPTTASQPRVPLLHSALDSLFAQTNTKVLPIVVVNGGIFEQAAVDNLRFDRRIRLVQREEPGAPKAVAAGRATVDTKFFGVLDDDDLYLPNACDVRRAVLNDDLDADAAVTNGYRRTSEGDRLVVPPTCEIEWDPAGSLMRNNWMASCSALYRTSSVGIEFFQDAPAVTEWTYVALRLALTRKIRYVDTPTYIVNTGTSDSVSKSLFYVRNQPAAIAAMLSLAPPPEICRNLQRKLCAALNGLSHRELDEGNSWAAWKAHLRCMRSTAGLRYLGHTRRLLLRGAIAGTCRPQKS